MACPMKCQTCGTLLSDKHPELEKILQSRQLDARDGSVSTSQTSSESGGSKEKFSLNEEFEKLELDNYCCRMKIISCLNYSMEIQ